MAPSRSRLLTFAVIVAVTAIPPFWYQARWNAAPSQAVADAGAVLVALASPWRGLFWTVIANPGPANGVVAVWFGLALNLTLLVWLGWFVVGRARRKRPA